MSFKINHCKNCVNAIKVNSCGAIIYYCKKRPSKIDTTYGAKFEKVNGLSVCKEHKRNK